MDEVKITNYESVDLFDIPICKVTIEQALDRAEESIRSRSSLNIGVVNAAKIVNMQRDPALREALLSSDEIYADGMSVVWASRVLRASLPERVTGIDLMHGLLARGNENNYRFYLLGATQDVVEKTVAEFSRSYPGAKVCGFRNGYFDKNDEEQIATEIREAVPDVLFVAITSPKKEQFMARWGDVIQVPVVHGVGGSFDVVAGVTKRAPVSWQKAGFEWLYRLIQEPRRLFGRYFVTNTKFIGLVLAEKLKRVTT